VKDIKDIEKLFSESFESFEAPVNPELWNGISQGISAAGSAGSSAVGIGLFTKLIVAAGVIGTIGVVSFFGLKDDKDIDLVENTTPTTPESENNNTNQLVVDSFEEKNENAQKPNAVIKETPVPIREQRTENTAPLFDEKIEDKLESKSVVLPKQQKEVDQTLDKTTTAESTIDKADSKTENRNKDSNNPLPNNTQTVEKQIEVPYEAPTTAEDRVLKEINQQRGLFPNAFTPNNDGVNDFLEIKVEEELSYFKIEVFTTKGELVYFSEDLYFRWDGNHLNGSPVPTGKYVYQIESKNLNGQTLKPIVKLVDLIR